MGSRKIDDSLRDSLKAIRRGRTSRYSGFEKVVWLGAEKDIEARTELEAKLAPLIEEHLSDFAYPTGELARFLLPAIWIVELQLAGNFETPKQRQDTLIKWSDPAPLRS
jgi:hypothetical protein